MCGIVGAVVSADAKAELQRGVASLAHRGPDDSGNWNEGGAQLGFTRLAIIDLTESGHQPMVSPDDRYVIVFNGEIYNFAELRAQLQAAGETFRGHSDTEVLLRVFMREGLERCLTKLRGMFAFAVWDRREKTLSLARDRLGVKPLVYAETPRGFLFASEIQALFALDPALSREPDIAGIDHFLTFQYIPAPMSGFAALRKLPPAHAMVVRNARVERVFRYWDLDLTKRSDLSFSDACEALREQMLEATRLRMVSDVPLGAFLSGGIDSSITVAAMAKLGASPLRTFSIGFEDERFNELPYAREVATHLGTEHHEMMVKADAVAIMPMMIDYLGEPLADNSVMPTYYVSRFARTGVTVALTGDGGDEVFAGYRRYVFDVAENRVRHVIGRPGRRLLALVGRGYPKLDWAPRFLRAKSTLANFARDPAHAYWSSVTQLSREDALDVLAPDVARALADHDPFDAFEDDYRRPAVDDPLYRAQYADFHGFLPDQILAKSDRASMGASLELRPPLLDHRFVERFANLPAREKVRGGRGKHALREALRGRLPARVLDGPKMGFEIPLRAWLAGPLSPVVASAIESLPASWFRRERLREVHAQHGAGLRDHSHLLWSIVVLEHWRRRHSVDDDLA